VAAFLAWFAARHLYSRFERRLAITDSASAEPPGGAMLLPSLRSAEQWLNGGDAAIDSLHLRPTLLLLWNDTRPSCLRVLPRAQAWHEAYGRYGLNVVGVYEPEFTFGADSAMAEAAAQRLHLTFPIALDPSLRIGSTFGVSTNLPRLILFDRSGHAREQFGSTGIVAMESAIRRELSSYKPELRFPADPGSSAVHETMEPTWPPTVYLGTSRVTSGPLSSATPGREQLFTAQFRYQVEGEAYTPYPVGLWKPTSEGITAGRGGAENFVALRYDAGTLGAVMSPESGAKARVWILRDEQWLTRDMLGADARLDGRGGSYVDVDTPRWYELCRDSRGEHVVKLSPQQPGVTLHALTFEPANEPARP
jgi:thiol-disulfide isomerase/thioredoxin